MQNLLLSKKSNKYIHLLVFLFIRYILFSIEVKTAMRFKKYSSHI